MQLLPSNNHSKFLPVGLAVIALILIYFVGFHWFVMRHIAYADDIELLEDQYQRFSAITAQRDDLSAQLQEIQANRQNDTYFLQQENANSAAAGMTNRLKQTVNRVRDDDASCQVISNQTVRPRTQERFERVTVKVRMRCKLSDFIKVLHHAEESVPMIFIDDLQLYQQPPRRTRRNGQTVQNRPPLDIRFDMTGYLKS